MSFIRIPKVIVIGFLAAVLGIALIAVMGLVSERSERRDQVYQDLAKNTVSSQTIVGPILVFPYEMITPVRVVNEQGIKSSSLETIERYQFVLPKQLQMNARLKAESRFRGLYEVPFYRSNIDMTGHFELTPPSPPLAPEGSSIRARAPFLIIVVQDSRGVLELPRFRANEMELTTQSGLGGMNLGGFGGFHAPFPAHLQGNSNFTFSVALTVQGTQAFHWVSQGEESKVTLSSNWPHPSFQGAALPSIHEVSSKGFEAKWESTQFTRSPSPGSSPDLLLASFTDQKVGIKLIQPVDIYVQTERSVKYGFLIVALTFLAFLAFETIRNLDIHPIQYGFVGVALVLFYVLLLAISEHLTFAYAYVLASVACISLLSSYIRSIIGSWRLTLGFASSLSGMYFIIFGILLSEDYALLYGSVFLFLLLALAMVTTRHVDWNGLNKRP